MIRFLSLILKYCYTQALTYLIRTPVIFHRDGASRLTHTSLSLIFKSKYALLGGLGGGFFGSNDSELMLQQSYVIIKMIEMKFAWSQLQGFPNLEVWSIKTLIIQGPSAWVCLVFKPLLDMFFSHDSINIVFTG